MYNLKWESSYTTYFNNILEVYGSSIGELYLPPDKRFHPKGDLDLVETQDEESHKASSSAIATTPALDDMKMNMINTLSSIDSAADTFKTDYFFMFVMTSMIVIFVAYFTGNNLINETWLSLR